MTNIPEKPHVLIDSDAFIAWLKPDDSLHNAVVEIFRNIQKRNQVTVTTSLVVAETATTLSYKVSQEAALGFLEFVQNLPIIHITDELQAQTIELFKQQTKKGTSVVDCSNAIVMQQFNIPTILSFDKVYSKKFGLTAAV